MHLAGYEYTPDIYTLACSVAEYSVFCTFDCALSGPFDNLFLTWLSATQALCEGIIAVISASTVYIIMFLDNILPQKKFVNTFYMVVFAFLGYFTEALPAHDMQI